MSRTAPLKQLLVDTITYWDHSATSSNVRETFWKIIKCGTPALGAEVFGVGVLEKIVYHTCKSRFCPSCGARAAGIWQAQLESVIPDTVYREINFTMPRCFWPLFQQNRELLNGLPSVAATALEFWVSARYNVRVILMVVLQTYGGFLNFYPHLHALISAGGLDTQRRRWIPGLQFTKQEHRYELMLAWKLALLSYLEAAIKADALKSELMKDELTSVLHAEGKRDWNIFVGRGMPKRLVIDHIGRYIRRPPIAQYRLSRVSDQEVQYLAKDTRNKCLTPVIYRNEEFLDLLIPHIMDRYCNSVFRASVTSLEKVAFSRVWAPESRAEA